MPPAAGRASHAALDIGLLDSQEAAGGQSRNGAVHPREPALPKHPRGSHSIYVNILFVALVLALIGVYCFFAASGSGPGGWLLSSAHGTLFDRSDGDAGPLLHSEAAGPVVEKSRRADQLQGSKAEDESGVQASKSEADAHRAEASEKAAAPGQEAEQGIEAGTQAERMEGVKTPAEQGENADVAPGAQGQASSSAQDAANGGKNEVSTGAPEAGPSAEQPGAQEDTLPQGADAAGGASDARHTPGAEAPQGVNPAGLAGPEEDEGPDLSRPSRCADECFKHGTCSEERGECSCETQYTGENCSDLAMPACHLAPGYWTPCSLVSTCECHVQCSKWRLPTAPVCLRGTDPNGTKITNLTEIFSGPTYGLTWNQDATEFQAPNYNLPPVSPNSDATAPQNCPAICNGRGVCSRESSSCQCTWASRGEACAEWGFHVPCFNKCSGKGHCSFGVCLCDRGFFGMDCALYLDKDGKTRILKRPPYDWAPIPWPPPNGNLRPRIYVYDLPNYFHTWQGLHSAPYDWPEPVWFIERLLNTPYRTPDPAEADFFFFPLFIRNRDGNRANIIAWAKDWARTHYPFWNRSGGLDHFVLTNSDWGNCELWGTDGYGVMHHVLDDMSTVTLWGHARSMHLDNVRPCFRPGRDIVIPPDMEEDVYRYAPGLGGPPLAEDRSILLYFRGYSAEQEQPWGSGNYTWSFGVRQEVFKHFRDSYNETGILLDTMESGDRLRHLEFMRKSIFCLAPTGWGWGMRTTQAVIMGCIPVVIQPYVYQAFDGDGLDWSEFSVRVEKHDIPRLPEILAAVQQDQIDRMRQEMERVRWRFIWTSTNHNPFPMLQPAEQEKLAAQLVAADAFFGVMEALRLRLEKQKG